MNKFVTDLCKCGISVVGVLRKVSRYMLIISCLNPLSGKESFRLDSEIMLIRAFFQLVLIP